MQLEISSALLLQFPAGFTPETSARVRELVEQFGAIYCQRRNRRFALVLDVSDEMRLDAFLSCPQLEDLTRVWTVFDGKPSQSVLGAPTASRDEFLAARADFTFHYLNPFIAECFYYVFKDWQTANDALTVRQKQADAARQVIANFLLNCSPKSKAKEFYED